MKNYYPFLRGTRFDKILRIMQPMLKRSKKDKPLHAATTAADADTDTEAKNEPAEEIAAPLTDSAPGSDGPGAEAPPSAADEATRLRDQYIRLMADFDNYRKRQAREREDYIKRSNERLLGDILPVVDNLELALQKINDPEEPFARGVRLVYDQFQGVLKRCGLTPIEAKGAVFNPDLHEALSYIPSPTVPANQVIDQFRCGWDLSGHLMRAAQVIVSSGSPDEEASAQEGVSD